MSNGIPAPLEQIKQRLEDIELALAEINKVLPTLRSEHLYKLALTLKNKLEAQAAILRGEK